MISKYFPAGHPRSGQETEFLESIWQGLTNAGVKAEVPVDSIEKWPILNPGHHKNKIHTIRGNYALWSQRAEKINRGEAVLSLRQWTGSPYNRKRDGSRQQEFLRLEKISVQEVTFGSYPFLMGMVSKDFDGAEVHGNKDFPHNLIKHDVLAKNDGLSRKDYNDWFGIGYHDNKGVKHLAIIHFTDFKY